MGDEADEGWRGFFVAHDSSCCVDIRVDVTASVESFLCLTDGNHLTGWFRTSTGMSTLHAKAQCHLVF